MTLPERVESDYRGMDLSPGPHPMRLLRRSLPDIWRAADLPQARNGDYVAIGGSVICRQRPGTAKGFVFISLEDETGVSNAIVAPDLFEKLRLLITQEQFLLIRGRLQNSENVIHVRAEQIEPLPHEAFASTHSHDFR
jgi:error-prone DNA polymerase